MLVTILVEMVSIQVGLMLGLSIGWILDAIKNPQNVNYYGEKLLNEF